jgi:hypothetical protein
MRSWKSHRLTSHTWLGQNPQIGRPLSKIVGAIGLFLFFMSVIMTRTSVIYTCITMRVTLERTN